MQSGSHNTWYMLGISCDHSLSLSLSFFFSEKQNHWDGFIIRFCMLNKWKENYDKYIKKPIATVFVSFRKTI